MSYLLTMFELVVKWGFTITLPILLLVYFIKRDWRPFIKSCLSYSYVLVFVYFVVELAGKTGIFIEQLIPSMSSNKVYDYYHGSDRNTILYFGVVFKLLLALAFMFKRLRNSVAWGIAALLTLQNEELTLAIWYKFRNFYPSSWAIYYHFPFGIKSYIFCPIVFIALTSLLYFSKKLLLKNKSNAPVL